MKKPPDVILSTVSTLLQMPSSDLIEMLSNHHANKGQQKEAEWLTLEEAAQFARVSRWTIRRWCKQGKLDFRKTNRARCGRIIIRATSLCNLIDSFNNPED